MKTHTFSIVAGTSLCNANCPFCVSKLTCRAAPKHDINWSRFHTACKIVEQARDGLVTVLITGTGEPTLYPRDITDYLKAMQERFPIVTLQTNGRHLNESLLEEWRDLGLTQVCISITARNILTNAKLMRFHPNLDYWRQVDLLHELNLSVRLNCTMLKDGISEPEEVEDLLISCKRHGVEQLTLREVDRPDKSSNEVAEYVDRQKPVGAAQRLYHYLFMHGANRLTDLPHGGTVFDYNGQNVCISNCLTDTPDPNDIRQIIFFPTGEISYDWKYKGARIL